MDPAVAVLLSHVSAHHDLRLYMYSWRTFTRQQQAKREKHDFLHRLTLYRIKRRMEELGVDGLYENWAPDIEDYTEIAIQFTRLSCEEFLAVVHRGFSPPTDLLTRGVWKGIRLAASSFVNEEPIESMWAEEHHSVPP